MGTAVGAGAAAAAEQERVLECFRVADATAADRAEGLERLGLVGNPVVERLAKAGVVLDGVAPDTVYLSETAYAAYRRGAQRRVLWAALAGGVMLLVVGGAAFMIARRGR